MNINQLKKQIISSLTPAVGPTEASAMSQEIFRYLLGLEPVNVVLEGSRSVEPETVAAATRICDEVINGSPLQYVLGYAWFMGMKLAVKRGVLIPRPETAQLVDIIVDQWKDRSDLQVLDIGTGSGCIAIALARALPFPTVWATDINDDALAIARRNAVAMHVRILYTRDDIFTMKLPAASHYDIIVSNPPYITEKERATMDPRVSEWEPASALFVPDSDPLRFYRAIAHYASTALKPDGTLYFEINPPYANDLKAMLAEYGFSDVDIIRDFRGLNRFAVCRR